MLFVYSRIHAVCNILIFIHHTHVAMNRNVKANLTKEKEKYLNERKLIANYRHHIYIIMMMIISY